MFILNLILILIKYLIYLFTAQNIFFTVLPISALIFYRTLVLFGDGQLSKHASVSLFLNLNLIIFHF